MTVGHLLAVLSRVEFHEADVVLHRDGSKHRRPHALATRGKLPAGILELLVRRFKASASLRRCRGSTRWIHRLVGLRLRKSRLLQYSLEEEAADDWVKDRRELRELRRTASRHVGRLLE